MGVDAGIFALKSKKYYWFDRAQFLQGWRFNRDMATKRPVMCDRAEMLHNRAYKPDHFNQHLSAAEMSILLEISSYCWATMNDDRWKVSEDVLKFVRMFPDDLFSIKSDHGGEWPECCNEYEEVKYEELL